MSARHKTLITDAVSNAGSTFKRFWGAFLFSWIGTIAALVLIESEENKSAYQYLFTNLVYICVIGISFLTALTLFAERNNFKNIKNSILQVAAILLLAGYFFTLPQTWNTIHYFKAILLMLSLHCFVAFAAFIKRGTVEGFWQFNKSIFIHIIVTGIYTSVLFVGITLAILATVNLFGLKMYDRLLMEVFVSLLGIFNTWFFLSGVPANYDELDSKKDYPKGLKIFTQFILIPLVTVYFVILYAYMAKIIIQWELPKGLVSYLIIFFSFFGILSLLLIYPLQNLDTEKWIKIFSQWFYRALFPLIVLLFIAVSIRISDYGITESRYCIVVMAFWLAGISLYLLKNKLHNIRIIPITLCLVCLLTSFGPWGAFSISQISQLKRLTKLLEKNDLLNNGKLVKPKTDVPINDQQQLASIIFYLSRAHGEHVLYPFLTEEIKLSFKAEEHKHNFGRRIISFLEINYESTLSRNNSSDVYSFYYAVPAEPEKAYLVTDFDYFFDKVIYGISPKDLYTVKIGEEAINYTVNAKEATFTYKNDLLTLSFGNVQERLKNIYKLKDSENVKGEDSVFIVENKKIKLKINVIKIIGEILKDGSLNTKSFEFQCFVKLK